MRKELLSATGRKIYLCYGILFFVLHYLVNFAGAIAQAIAPQIGGM